MITNSRFDLKDYVRLLIFNPDLPEDWTVVTSLRSVNYGLTACAIDSQASGLATANHRNGEPYSVNPERRSQSKGQNACGASEGGARQKISLKWTYLLC